MLNSKFSLLATMAICLVVATIALAKGKDAGNPTKWLNEGQEKSLSASVPPPPAADSAEDKADLTKILEVQKARTQEVVAECKRDEKFSYKLFESVYGNTLTPANSPKFFEMLDNVTAATRVVNEAAKNKYKRLRPYQGHPGEVKALFSVSGFSYPSGHSMGSFTLATVLAAVFPDKKQALLDRAAQIAQSRVDAGVHYPSDIAEGEVLGKATGTAIVASTAFQADLVAVQAELKK